LENQIQIEQRELAGITMVGQRTNESLPASQCWVSKPMRACRHYYVQWPVSSAVVGPTGKPNSKWTNDSSRPKLTMKTRTLLKAVA
jgi:hypothetical protein